MKLSVILVFLLLFAAVLGCYVYLSLEDWQSNPKLAGGGGQSMQLLPLKEGDSIRWIQIQNPAKNLTATLELEDGKWMLKYPVVDRADVLIIGGFSAALRLSTKARRLAREKGWEEYGLETPALKVGIETLKNRTRRYLCLGDKAPIGNFVYARWENGNDYFLLNADLKRVFDQTVYGLREKRVFRLALKDAVKVTVKTPEGGCEASKIEDGWYWSEPVMKMGEELPKQDLDFLFSEIERIHVKDFLDENKKSPEELELGSSAPRQMTVRNADGSEETLLIGEALPSRDAYYAMREGETNVFLVSKSKLDNFLHDLGAMANAAVSGTKAA